MLKGVLVDLADHRLVAMVIGIALGVVVAIMRLSPNRLLSAIAWTYTWFFRGTPVSSSCSSGSPSHLLYPHLTLGDPLLAHHVRLTSTRITLLAR